MIVEHAKRNHWDQIIMDTRAMGALSNLVVGPVAMQVIHLSDIAVTLVK